MKKRLGIFLGITAVSVLAVVGVFAGIAAQDGQEDGGKRSFAERVASILGLEAETVEDAFAQVKEEMVDERSDAYLAKLVEHGKLTQEEADAIVAWKDAKPDIEFSFGELTKSEKRGWGGKGFGRGYGSEMLSGEKLDYLVEEGVLTQANADSLSAWYDERPGAVVKLMPNKDKRGRWGDGGKDWHGKKSRWGHKWGDKGDDV